MIRTQVSFERDTYIAAKREARREGISLAEFCRRAIRRALEGREGGKPWMRFAGSLRSGDADASRTVDEVVYGRAEP
jgi:hypothetical protein